MPIAAGGALSGAQLGHVVRLLRVVDPDRGPHREQRDDAPSITASAPRTPRIRRSRARGREAGSAATIASIGQLGVIAKSGTLATAAAAMRNAGLP